MLAVGGECLGVRFPGSDAEEESKAWLQSIVALIMTQ